MVYRLYWIVTFTFKFLALKTLNTGPVYSPSWLAAPPTPCIPSRVLDAPCSPSLSPSSQRQQPPPGVQANPLQSRVISSFPPGPLLTRHGQHSADRCLSLPHCCLPVVKAVPQSSRLSLSLSSTYSGACRCLCSVTSLCCEWVPQRPIPASPPSCSPTWVVAVRASCCPLLCQGTPSLGRCPVSALVSGVLFPQMCGACPSSQCLWRGLHQVLIWRKPRSTPYVITL